MKRIVNLGLFTLLCIALVLGIFYGEDIYNSFNKGDYHDLVVDDKPTLIAFFDESKRNNNSHKTASELLASLGIKYNDQLATSVITVDIDYAEYLMERLNISDDKVPAMVLLNHRGYIVSLYEGNIPVEAIDHDVSQVVR